jgi:hypothetical protein
MKGFVGLVLAVGAVFVAVPVAMLIPERVAPAADHLDPPTRTDPAFDTTPDTPADIADVYSWYTPTKVIVAVTFAGPQAANMPAVYDRDVLYTLNIGNGVPKSTPTFRINWRFGADRSTGTPRYGVEVSGLPGVSGAIIGPVEENLTKDGIIVRAGLFDDPFFFDLVGFRTSRSTGVLSFDKNRDFFNGQNDTAIVFEIPRDRLANGTNPLGIWATTARIGGQL